MAGNPFLLRITLLLCLFAGFIGGAGAADIVPEKLAGWWLAVDNVQPQFSKAAKVIPAEELLILDKFGRADTRLMVFNPVDARNCVARRACSDAPLLQHTSFTVADDLLIFQPPTADDEVHILTKVDLLRPIVVTSAPAWLMRLSAGGKMLFLAQPNGSAARAFARIDPAELGRIRAGFQQTRRSVVNDWRCFVAHATAGDPAFLPLYHGESAPPPWFRAFLQAASYFEAVRTATRKPPPGMADKSMQEWSEAPLQTILIAQFPDAGFPQTMAEGKTLVLKYDYLTARAEGLDDAAARTRIANKSAGEEIVLSVGEEALATLALAQGPELSEMMTCN